MGANSGQGWCLFVFLVGFTSLVAGLAYLGPVFTIVGAVLLVASLVGFYRLKPLEEAGASGHSGASDMSQSRDVSQAPGRVAKAR